MTTPVTKTMPETIEIAPDPDEDDLDDLDGAYSVASSALHTC
jgi:hypothetical protein